MKYAIVVSEETVMVRKWGHLFRDNIVIRSTILPDNKKKKRYFGLYPIWLLIMPPTSSRMKKKLFEKAMMNKNTKLIEQVAGLENAADYATVFITQWEIWMRL